MDEDKTLFARRVFEVVVSYETFKFLVLCVLILMERSASCRLAFLILSRSPYSFARFRMFRKSSERLDVDEETCL